MSETEGGAQASDDGFTKSSSFPSMGRGITQVLFNYLPERTFDYDSGACIGKVFELRLEEVSGIDVERLVATIQQYVAPWGDRVSDLDLRRSYLLLFGKPTGVLFNLFPLAFQCGRCERVKTFENERAFEASGGVGRCIKCGSDDRFEQVYHVLVHECGQIAPIRPPECKSCHNASHVALDLRGSQAARDFRWLCKACGRDAGHVQRPCGACATQVSEAGGARSTPMMRLIPHRANQAFYPHSVTVLNLPTDDTARLRDHPLRDRILTQAVVEDNYDVDGLITIASGQASGSDSGADDERELLSFAKPEEVAGLAEHLNRLRELRRERNSQAARRISESAAGMTEGGWLEALEYLNLHTRDRRTWDQLRREIEARQPGSGVAVDRFRATAAKLGIIETQLILDFPVVTAVFGYTRVSFEPKSKLYDQEIHTTLCGFATPRTGPQRHRNRRPVFVDDSSTEGLLFKLSPTAVIGWLRARGHAIDGAIDDSMVEARRWLLSTVQTVDRFATLHSIGPVSQDVFSLVHTFAHLTIRALARISGIERTSIAEYLFPRVAAFAVYNTKAGTNLGGLNTVFAELQDTLFETIGSDVLLRTCVYDPVCADECMRRVTLVATYLR